MKRFAFPEFERKKGAMKIGRIKGTSGKEEPEAFVYPKNSSSTMFEKTNMNILHPIFIGCFFQIGNFVFRFKEKADQI
jgi:hypothetical protein